MRTIFKVQSAAADLIAIGLICLAFSACQKESNSSLRMNAATSEVAIRMTDSPGDFLAVNVDIRSVELLYVDSVHSGCSDTLYHSHGINHDSIRYSHCDCDDDTARGRWVTLDTRAGIYNLLNLQNGLDTLIASGQIQPGRIIAMRLILGPNNSVMLLADTIHLTIPGGMESGLKIPVHQTVNSQNKLTLLFDFDAGASIIVTGNEHILLKPVIRLKMSS
jgi:hypothetical protein